MMPWIRHIKEYKMCLDNNEEPFKHQKQVCGTHASSQTEDGSGAKQEGREPLELNASDRLDKT